ncbi:MAG TPA: thiamine pyrophosphate-dependent enzyme [Afifellaceae bacterium]|nr:thiamine pyrophosphate-dependent enzyme [Afifellaceae bacterium]
MPASAEALVETMARANLVTRSAPTAPVYVCLDAGLQEAPLQAEPAWPDLARFAPPEPPRPPRAAVEKAAALLDGAERPLMLVGRGARTREAWAARVALAERLGACVVTDLKVGASFPSEHPAATLPPFNQMPAAARELLCEADAILALDWVDLGGALKQAGSAGEVTARIVAASLDQHLHNGFNMDYLALPPVDVAIAASADALTAELVEALGQGQRQPWRERRPAKEAPDLGPDGPVDLRQVAAALWSAFPEPERVSLAAQSRGWPFDLWPLKDPLAYLGKDGGGGVGSGPGLSVGAALALHERGRLTVSVIGDGDFVMGVQALWTAVHHQIPLLVLVNNNRSYFNDELHQESVARRRGREPRNRWIGQRLADPELDLVKLAEAQGAVGIGPVRKAGEVEAALQRGVAVLQSGGVCVIDLHVDSGEERTAQAIQARPAGQ